MKIPEELKIWLAGIFMIISAILTIGLTIGCFAGATLMIGYIANNETLITIIYYFIIISVVMIAPYLIGKEFCNQK